ncbi:hypothetical protein D3C71_1372370 [compost metagenome]
MAVLEAQFRMFSQPLFQADNLALLVGHGAVGVAGEAAVLHFDADGQRAVGAKLGGNGGHQVLARGGNDQNAITTLAVPQQPLAGGRVDSRQDIAANIALHPAGHRFGTQAGQRRQRGLHVVLHGQLALIIVLHQLLFLLFQFRRCKPFSDQPTHP